jgi:hypothetical protein
MLSAKMPSRASQVSGTKRPLPGWHEVAKLRFLFPAQRCHRVLRGIMARMHARLIASWPQFLENTTSNIRAHQELSLGGCNGVRCQTVCSRTSRLAKILKSRKSRGPFTSSNHNSRDEAQSQGCASYFSAKFCDAGGRGREMARPSSLVATFDLDCRWPPKSIHF